MIRATTAPSRGGKTRALIVLISLLALASSAGCQQASGEQTTGGPEGGQEGKAEVRTGGEGGAAARAGDAGARVGGDAEARAGDAVAEAESQTESRVERSGDGGNVREVALEVEGDPGTGFSGKCTIGNEQREIGGRVPERFIFELDGQKLECEISKQSAGAMNIVLDAGGADYVQRTDSRRATVSIVYSRRGYSSSIQSSIGSSRQTINAGSSSIVSSSSSSITRTQ